jgi:hypothetical protein
MARTPSFSGCGGETERLFGGKWPETDAVGEVTVLVDVLWSGECD